METIVTVAPASAVASAPVVSAPTVPAPVVPADDRVLFYRRDRAEWGFLSHFFPSPIEIEGERWPTVEHYYQSRKSFDPAYVAAIRAATTPGRAKRLSADPALPRKISRHSWFRRHGAKPRADWREVKLEIMRAADAAKYGQNRMLAALLLASGDAEIVEDSPTDAFWGVGPDGNGDNWAGKILMEVRESLRAQTSSSEPPT